MVGASRLLFALGRDGGPAALGPVAPASGTPGRATVVVVLAMYLVIALAWLGLRRRPVRHVPVESGTIGTLILLVAYVLATVGASSCCSSPAHARCRVARS